MAVKKSTPKDRAVARSKAKQGDQLKSTKANMARPGKTAEAGMANIPASIMRLGKVAIDAYKRGAKSAVVGPAKPKPMTARQKAEAAEFQKAGRQRDMETKRAMEKKKATSSSRTSPKVKQTEREAEAKAKKMYAERLKTGTTIARGQRAAQRPPQRPGTTSRNPSKYE